MKSQGYKVELVTEFAKDLVYQESFFRLKDQLMILARQNHKLWVLKDKVDYAIVDSPLLLSQHYFQNNGDYSEKLFKDFVLDTYNRYNNLNIFLKRNNEEHPYQEYGRSQTLDEAIKIDESIKKILQNTKSEYKTVLISSSTVNNILKLIDLFNNHTDCIYGIEKKNDYSTNAIIYFEIPGMEQISWHIYLSNDIINKLPTYPNKWDCKVNSTLYKLENKIKKDYNSIIY
jgi:hypothetical protein